MKLYNILEMAEPKEYHRSKEWYHGTSDISGILRDGYIIPGNLDDVKSLKMFTPLYNRSYVTSNIEYALVYAFGGHLSNKTPYNKTAYICVISGNNLGDIEPDEDLIAEIIQLGFDNRLNIREK